MFFCKQSAKNILFFIFSVIIIMEVKNMKKKYGLLKVLSVLLLVVVVFTYFIKDRQGSITYLALGDVFLNYLQSFYYFFDTALFILVVGGFYGVLNRIPAYKSIIKNIVNKMEGKGNLFVVVTTVVLALVSSLTGLNVLLLLVIPMVVSVILLLGYDKLVALSATVGSIVIGLIGGVFLTVKDPSNYYSVSYTTIDKLVGLDGHYANLIPKILLLVVGIGLLVWYIISHTKRVEAGNDSYELSNTDVLFVDAKTQSSKEEKNKKVSVWPLGVILVFVLILLVLGYLPWADLFELEIFNEFHTWLSELKIGDYAVFPSLISNSFSAFGTWASLGSYMMAIVVVAIFTVILTLVYRIKFEDAMDGFMYGVKKMLPAAMVVTLAYCVLVCSYNHGFVETIITIVAEKFGDNAIVNSFVVLVGSVFNVDLYYTSAGIFTSIASNLSEGANLAVYASMFQSLYGLVQIIGPTSIILLVGLSYLEVPYKTWLKYIWRFVVELLIVILLVLMLVSIM